MTVSNHVAEYSCESALELPTYPIYHETADLPGDEKSYTLHFKFQNGALNWKQVR